MAPEISRVEYFRPTCWNWENLREASAAPNSKTLETGFFCLDMVEARPVGDITLTWLPARRGFRHWRPASRRRR